MQKGQTKDKTECLRGIWVRFARGGNISLRGGGVAWFRTDMSIYIYVNPNRKIYIFVYFFLHKIEVSLTHCQNRLSTVSFSPTQRK
jgi:hypothetical protein